MRIAVFLTLIINAAGCTMIEITDQQGAVSVERSFGFAAVKAAPDAGVVTAKISSLGYVASPLGYSVGYSRQTVTSADNACRVIIWLEDNTDKALLAEKLQSIDSVCYSQ